MGGELRDRRVALVAADGVEHAQLIQPREAVRKAGAHVRLVSVHEGWIQSVHADDETGDPFRVNVRAAEAFPSDYDALLLPGGTSNLERLRSSPETVGFVRAFAGSGKPVGAIGHGPGVLIEADVVRGRTLTSTPGIQSDIRNAGGIVPDEDVVTDHGLVTGRDAHSLPAFCPTIVERFTKRHRRVTRWLRSTPSPQRRF